MTVLAGLLGLDTEIRPGYTDPFSEALISRLIGRLRSAVIISNDISSRVHEIQCQIMEELCRVPIPAAFLGLMLLPEGGTQPASSRFISFSIGEHVAQGCAALRESN